MTTEQDLRDLRENDSDMKADLAALKVKVKTIEARDAMRTRIAVTIGLAAASAVGSLVYLLFNHHAC